MINLDIISLIIFIVVLTIIVLLNRHKVRVNKMLFPLLYIIMYKTRWGIPLMDRIARKNKELAKLIGYCCIGIGWAGMIFISYNIILAIVRFLMAPRVTETGMSLVFPGTTIPGMGLVFPGTTIPGIGYLSFWYWLIALFILAFVHEFSHGIVARAHDLELKSSGFAVLGIIVPLFPAAFVEPDEKKLAKRKDIEQYSIFAAGPIANLFLALVFAIIFFSIMIPLESRYVEAKGFTVDVTNADYPAAKAGLANGTLITSFNDKPVSSWQDMVNQLSNCVKPGDTVKLGNENTTYTIVTVPHPDNKNTPLLGITNFKNSIEPKNPGFSIKTFQWFRELVYWIFLLNFFVGLANLLPIFITDGARMLQIALLRTIKKRQTAMAVWNMVNLLFVLLIIVGLLGNYLKGIIF